MAQQELRSVGEIGWGRLLAAFAILWLLLWYALAVALYTSAFGTDFHATDFNMFHAAGRIAWERGLAAAYEIGALEPADIVGPGGGTHQMLFTYPPQFGFLIWPLGPLGRATAFALFVGVSLALYLYALVRLAGGHSGAVLLAGLPILMGAIQSGQTGLLVGGLAGLYALAALAGRGGGGVPLGLMAIKAHLAPGLALHALAGGRWRVLAVAALTVILSLALAALVFGMEVWRPFLEAGRAAAERLSEKEFKLNRMTSVYALAATAGASHALAMALHLAGAALAALAVVLAARSALAPRVKLGLAVLFTLAFSPYVYDYDLTILVIALALLWGELVVRTALWERLVLGALAWLTTYYVYVGLFAGGGGPAPNAMATDDPLAIQALAYLALVALVCLVLRRQPRAA